ncbi:hypothetical protein BpHYR1_000268 [Brachionus plicatilis]|uniref:Uncharacterized protein n=1 Tax=Brachionus plicatilis TaxID=10195 RepID=A0A3M7QFL8_BRAPC|nr:hypothetical protein BpHYR1_000268 [Brachionus plicatilis]
MASGNIASKILNTFEWNKQHQMPNFYQQQQYQHQYQQYIQNQYHQMILAQQANQQKERNEEEEQNIRKTEWPKEAFEGGLTLCENQEATPKKKRFYCVIRGKRRNLDENEIVDELENEYGRETKNHTD